ncbi:hypothetical protein [Bacillus massiliigorillae]|uniref:hypothetical protein n=1 Tax=Bacillus massiliigorillae TaxID=1243664 RepID=UPI00039CA119|nr:hypothetical protein [Bacillus massiliigorillae]
MSYLGIQTLPAVFVDNRTGATITDLTFYYNGLVIEEPRLKRIRPGERKIVSIYSRNIEGEKTLYMKHKKRNNEEQSYEIFNKLTERFWGNILIEILSIHSDGTLNIRVNTDFDYGV